LSLVTAGTGDKREMRVRCVSVRLRGRQSAQLRRCARMYRWRHRTTWSQRDVTVPCGLCVAVGARQRLNMKIEDKQLQLHTVLVQSVYQCTQ